MATDIAYQDRDRNYYSTLLKQAKGHAKARYGRKNEDGLPWVVEPDDNVGDQTSEYAHEKLPGLMKDAVSTAIHTGKSIDIDQNVIRSNEKVFVDFDEQIAGECLAAVRPEDALQKDDTLLFDLIDTNETTRQESLCAKQGCTADRNCKLVFTKANMRIFLALKFEKHDRAMDFTSKGNNIWSTKKMYGKE